MNWGLFRKALAFPGMVAVFIPLTIMFFTFGTKFAPKLASINQISLWLGTVMVIVGVFLCVWTVKLFLSFGDGTPAPWEPTKKLVVNGPYQYVRNPMITGILLVLIGESLLFQSLLIFFWFLFFFIFNTIYFPLIEEKGLEQRFGNEYIEYKNNVPRWIPKFKPWRK